MENYEEQTQKFSTFGDKLLQHLKYLSLFQEKTALRPINIQLAPTESCEGKCGFCSVKNRDITGKIPYSKISEGLSRFKLMGAKAVEITGGGNPLLYRDKDKNINNVINLANGLAYDIGLITNSSHPLSCLTETSIDSLNWLRISLNFLDEGFDKYNGENFKGIDTNKLSFSYIVNNKTTKDTIKQIRQVVEDNPGIKFVRFAPDCLNESSLILKEEWGSLIQEENGSGVMFIKEINDNFKPFPCGCYVGIFRPYWTYSGVYICTSHVLLQQKYDNMWKLCDIEQVEEKWEEMLLNMVEGKLPYGIDISKCWHCYYYNNNKLLYTIQSNLPDRNFA